MLGASIICIGDENKKKVVDEGEAGSSCTEEGSHSSH